MAVMFIGQRLDNFITGFTQTADQVKMFMYLVDLVFKFIFTSRFFEDRVLYQAKDIADGIQPGDYRHVDGADDP